MTTNRRSLIAGAGATAALATLPARLFAQGRPADTAAERVLSAIAERLLEDGPEGASSLGIDTGKRAALKSRLTDRSAAGQAAIARRRAEDLARLKAIDTAGLTPATRTDVDVTRTALESAVEGFALPYGDVAVGGWRNTPYVVIQNVGAYLDVPRFLDSDHSIATKADTEAYLARVDAFADALEGETGRLKDATAKGVIPPDFLLDKALGGMRTALAQPVAEWMVVTSIRNRARAVPGVDADALAKRATALIDRRVGPAMAAQIAELERQRARAGSNAGAWALPEGARYYDWALRASTTTRMTPDEVHRRGREELAALQAEMDTLLRPLGYTKGSVGARMTALGKDPRYLFRDNDDGRRQILALIADRLKDIRTRLPRAFGTLVPGNVEVRRLPLAEEPGAPGAYGGAGSIDGKVPGKFWINLRTTDLHSRYSLPTLTYHESIPGHVWQGEYAFRLPLIRTLLGFNAYSEGWALYAEQLAAELGVYEGNPVGRLGYLQSIAFRACRLVVDTGLHANRWTRDQAIRWFAETNGSGIEEVTSEVDRYCSWPGQACGYKIGHSEINRLREKAQAALGPRYDFRAYNDAVVTRGGVPMTVLERNIDAHIAARRG